MFDKGTHTMVLYITKNKEVKDYYLANPRATIASDPDIPHIEFKIRYSTLKSDLEDTKAYIEAQERNVVTSQEVIN